MGVIKHDNYNLCKSAPIRGPRTMVHNGVPKEHVCTSKKNNHDLYFTFLY